MGLNLGELVKGQELELDELRSRTIAIDSYNWAYQFLSIIRDRFTGEPLRDSKGRVTSHLSGLLYRTSKLLEEGVTPVYVWDGTPPKFKAELVEARIKVRKEAEVKWKEALALGKLEEARIAAQRATRLTDEMVEEAKKLLNYMGVCCIQAPSEGEAQCAKMCKTGQVWATASQDYDSLAFGSSRLVQNLSITGRRKVPRKEKWIEVKSHLTVLEDILKELGINQDQLIMLGILTGTDYAPGGVKGVGPKTALKLIKEHKTLDKILKEVSWEHPVSPQEILDFFKNPPVLEKKLELKVPALNPDKITNLMVKEHDFSEERIQKVTDKLEEIKEAQTQTGLGKFL